MKFLPVISYEKHFPFDSPREQQQKAIKFAVDSWFSENKKYVILEMGTGCGKSAIGVTLSRILQDYYSKNIGNEKFDIGTWYLTTQKVLQEQYMKDFGIGENTMRTIKSAGNYTCQMFDYSKIPLSCAEIHRLISAHDFFKKTYKICTQSCRYRKEKSNFTESMDSLTNYPYFFAATNHTDSMNPRKLLVLDEAHTIEEQLGKYVEVVISEKYAKDKLKKRMPKLDNPADVIMWVKKQYRPALKKKYDEIKGLLQDPNAKDNGKVKSLTDFAKQFEIVDKHLHKINRFLNEYGPDNWVMNLVPAFGKSMRKLVFKPVDVSKYAQENLFDMGEKVLMLSATILDKETYCRSIGLDPNQVAFHRVPSPFPLENRPIYVLPAGSMSKRMIDSTLPSMVEVVKLLLEQHPEEKGIIHCTNYKVAKYIHENVGSLRLLIHDSSNRDEMVDYHCNSDNPTVLVSPSMMEGVDLHDDRSRFQILCKLPFPFLGDEVVKKRMKLNSNWYDYQTVRSIIQAFGRSIRNENDYAVTYILDSDWERFYQRTSYMFPEEITKAIQSSS